jgi:hypothetical protein
MDYAYQAQPYIYVPAKTGLNLATMDVSFQAQPFVTNDYPTYPYTLAVEFITDHMHLTWSE